VTAANSGFMPAVEALQLVSTVRSVETVYGLSVSYVVYSKFSLQELTKVLLLLNRLGCCSMTLCWEMIATELALQIHHFVKVAV